MLLGVSEHEALSDWLPLALPELQALLLKDCKGWGLRVGGPVMLPL